VVSSDELKALETGAILADSLGLPCRSALGLQEHRRETGKIVDRETFMSQVANLFACPDEVVFGLESANQALTRFSEAIQSVMDSCLEPSVAIVSHGTVMSLYYGAVTGLDPYQFWSQLGLPGFYTVSWPDRVLQSLVNDVRIPGLEG
jgi:broad specificity phosphatase PhoE